VGRNHLEDQDIDDRTLFCECKSVVSEIHALSESFLAMLLIYSPIIRPVFIADTNL
jgi:hypothetical protein